VAGQIRFDADIPRMETPVPYIDSTRPRGRLGLAPHSSSQLQFALPYPSIFRELSDDSQLLTTWR